MSKYTDYNFRGTMKIFVSLEDFKEPTSIQQAVIPLACKGRNIIDISGTDTGKTHSFLIPTMERADSNLSVIQVVVMASTREFALQIYNRCEETSEADPRLHTCLIIDGMEKSGMSGQLEVQPHIVVGILRYIEDLLLQKQVLRVDTANIMAVNEANMALEFGFLEDVDAVAGKMKKNLQMMSFLAAVSVASQQFLKEHMDNPDTVRIQEQSDFYPKIEHMLIPCQKKSYEERLMELLAVFTPYACLILANTRAQAASATGMIRDAEYDIIELHGDLTPQGQTKAMKDLVSIQKPYVVATNIVARGVDIGGVSHVTPLGFPEELDYYIHRGGHTGRAGRGGICYTLYKKQNDAMIRSPRVKGAGFKYRNLKNSTWSELEPLYHKRVKKDDPPEKEISKIVSKKKEKVKPDYKVKWKQEVEKLKRKTHYQMIQKDIQRQKKEHAKQKVMEKRGGRE